MKSSILFFLLMILASCSLMRSSVTQNDTSVINSDASTQTKEGASVAVAPLPTVTPKSSKNTAVVFVPAIHRGLGYLPFLEEIKKNPELKVFVAEGLELTIISLYLAGYSPSRIEFLLYKFFTKLGPTQPFSEEWNDLIETTLLNKLKGKQFSTLKGKLLVPVFNKTSKQWFYITQGNLVDAIMQNLNSINPDTLAKAKVNPLFVDWSASKELKKYGVTDTIILDALSSQISFETPHDYWIGFYSALSATMQKQKLMQNTRYFSFPNFGHSLDFSSVPPNLMMKYTQFIKTISLKISSKQ